MTADHAGRLMRRVVPTEVPSLRGLVTTGTGRVRLFTVALAAAGIVLYLVVARGLSALDSPIQLPWWLLAGLFYVAEAKVVHFQLRRDAHSFSLSEIPLVLGLFFASPAELILAQALGAGIALRLHRNQSTLKLAFNISHFFLGTTVAVALFHLVAAYGADFGAATWGASFLAVLSANLLGILAIATAISLSEGRWQLEKISSVVRFGAALSATNTSLALLAVALLWYAPVAAWLLTIPVVTVFFAYRAYMEQRQKHENLQLLYESTRILNRSPQLDSAVLALVAHLRTMFRAEMAEITLFPTRAEGLALRTAVAKDGEEEVMQPVDSAETWRLRSGLPVDGKAFLAGTRAHGPLAGLIERPGLRNAMVVPLRQESGTFGFMLVGNRLGDVSTFDAEDQRLFETLASHTSMALANGQLEESLAQLTELKEQLRYQAFHDALTGLANRRLFTERVEQALTATDAEGDGPFVLFVDLDDFKTINDGLGHAAGDELLVGVAERLRRSVRAADLPARLGGDEFAVLLPTADLDEARFVAQRMLDALKAPFVLSGQEICVRASVGVAAASRSSDETADQLLRNADVAMYTAKARGKGRFEIFEPTMYAAVFERHALKADLERAVARDEFVLHYQPIVSLKSGRISGVEALVRWEHPHRGLVPPSTFISLAEETGLIVPIGGWVLEQACAQVHAWQQERPDDEPLALHVNISAREVQQAEFVAEVRRTLYRTGLAPESLVLEITETLMMQDTRSTLAKLTELKALGVKLAVDDFGTGYSSLSYLSRFPVDTLKIAKAFVELVGHGREDRAFADVILGLGHTLHLGIIAEGIETREQFDRLRELGCQRGQGYFLSEPAEAPVITETLRARDGVVAAVS